MTELKRINKCKEKIFAEIGRQHLKVRPKWFFDVIKTVWKFVFLLLLLFFGVIGVLLHFYAKNNHLVSVLRAYDGTIAKLVIFHFPFELIFAILLVILSVNLIGKKLEISYRVRPIYWYVGVFLSVVFIMFISELAGMFEVMEKLHSQKSGLLFKPYINKRLGNMDEHLFDGEVVGRNGSVVLIRTRINNDWSTSSFDGDVDYVLRDGEKVMILGNFEQNKLIVEKVFER